MTDHEQQHLEGRECVTHHYCDCTGRELAALRRERARYREALKLIATDPTEGSSAILATAIINPDRSTR